MNYKLTYARSWTNVRYFCVEKIKALYNELDELDKDNEILKSLLWTKIIMYKEILREIGYEDIDLCNIRDSDSNRYGGYYRP